jgi:hypothetical protein
VQDAQASTFTSSRQHPYERKKTKYQNLAQAIGGRPCDPGWRVHYPCCHGYWGIGYPPHCDPGWRVQVLPWVVGVRGVFDATGIQQAPTFLELPASKRKEILRKSAAASVEALVCMHKVRRSGASKGSIREVDAGQVEPAGEMHQKRKRRGESADMSGPMEDAEGGLNACQPSAAELVEENGSPRKERLEDEPMTRVVSVQDRYIEEEIGA